MPPPLDAILPATNLDTPPEMKSSPCKFGILGSIITDICNLSGIPGVSVGVLHHNEVIYRASFGYADIENNIQCDSDTTYVLGSLSKALTAAAVSALVEDETLTWTTKLKDVLPSFNRSDAQTDITLSDLLSHRTGLASMDALWLASNNNPYLQRSDAVHILNYAPSVAPVRAEFLYNNFAYEILGQVVEKRANAKFEEVLQERLWTPLGMNRTYYTSTNSSNEARPYAAFRNKSLAAIPTAIAGEDVLMGPAGGIRSSINDLLTLYKSFIAAAREDMTLSSPSHPSETSKSAIRGILELWQPKIRLPSRSLREHTYAFGWARAQLPAVLGRGDDGVGELDPLVGNGAPSRLALYHGGSIPGYNAFNALFPETDSAVVVLTNAQSLNGGVRWIGELIVEALFDNLENAADYRTLAKISAEAALEAFDAMQKALEEGRTVTKPARPASAYCGTYYNKAGNFYIEIKLKKGHQDVVFISFMGRDADTFELKPYQEDSFYWSLGYDEMVALARAPDYEVDYHIIKFSFDGTDVSLWWKHDPTMTGLGEAFEQKSGKHATEEDNQEL